MNLILNDFFSTTGDEEEMIDQPSGAFQLDDS